MKKNIEQTAHIRCIYAWSLGVLDLNLNGNSFILEYSMKYFQHFHTFKSEFYHKCHSTKLIRNKQMHLEFLVFQEIEFQIPYSVSVWKGEG